MTRGTPEELRARFEALGPWMTRYEVDGHVLGGTLDFGDDRRPPAFFEWFGSPRTILELSCFEGAHTLQLAAPPTTERVLGLDGRAENVARAALVAEVLGRGNIDVQVADLESADLTPFGRFDAVFCAGLLYHLAEPWHLVAQIATVSDRLFLDTHHCAATTDVVEVNGYHGQWYREGGRADPLSGLREQSFWPTLASLLRMLTDHGWAVRHVVEHLQWGGAGSRVWLGCYR